MKEELKSKAFPARPRRLKLHFKRDGQQVMIRKTDKSYFQIKAVEKQPLISFYTPPDRSTSKFPHHSFGMFVEFVWNYICDKLFS